MISYVSAGVLMPPTGLAAKKGGDHLDLPQLYSFKGLILYPCATGFRKKYLQDNHGLTAQILRR